MVKLLIEKLPRQTINRKIQLWVVKFNGEEIGVIEKMPNRPFDCRLIRGIHSLGQFGDKSECAKRIYETWKSV